MTTKRKRELLIQVKNGLLLMDLKQTEEQKEALQNEDPANWSDKKVEETFESLNPQKKNNNTINLN